MTKNIISKRLAAAIVVAILLICAVAAGASAATAARHPYSYTHGRRLADGTAVTIVSESDRPLSSEALEEGWQMLAPVLEKDLICLGYR